ncbi:MAG: hypothetical protein Q2306_01915 [Phytoplasma sp.]|uniref:hypothetical protein n=1 Tax=Phytoplasma sp. TaxID=2155 RepID=UPI002B402204|nr:hypothetical protein [Phytoplasma sp.]WRH06637.1 MAG: hypothetical protein Q2306_01915 [Phytoplasma sp.]
MKKISESNAFKKVSGAVSGALYKSGDKILKKGVDKVMNSFSKIKILPKAPLFRKIK